MLPTMASGTVSPRTNWIEFSPDGTTCRYSFFDANPGALRALMEDLFTNHWQGIVVGPCLDGAVFEIRFEAAPEVIDDNPFLTVNLGAGHFHLFGRTFKPTSEEHLQQPVARAALFERRGDIDNFRRWGLRVWNAFDQQMLTVWLPHDLYFELRRRILDEPLKEN